MELKYEIVEKLISNGKSISVMESCTSGMLASTITDVSGASEIFPGGFVTYCNSAKVMQGVPENIIKKYGVYSEETAAAMAKACMKKYDTDIGVGVTGSLGRPDPSNPDSKVGKVCYCIAKGDKINSVSLTVPDELTDRNDMKKYIVNSILEDILK